MLSWKGEKKKTFISISCINRESSFPEKLTIMTYKCIVTYKWTNNEQTSYGWTQLVHSIIYMLDSKWTPKFTGVSCKPKREMCENKYTTLYAGLITSSVNLNKLQFLIMIECMVDHISAQTKDFSSNYVLY
jgi:hypothetical protein